VQWVFAVLSRVSERGGKQQLNEFAPPQIRALRQSLGLGQPLVLLEVGTKDRSPWSSAASAG
jgi:hypothetical protein